MKLKNVFGKMVPDFFRCRYVCAHDTAGWYTPNSAYLGDIVPEYREPGGGTCSDQIVSAEEALDRAIGYTERHIEDANRHVDKLLKARHLMKQEA